MAEVASTFNEELLSHHLLEQSGDEQWRAYLINREIDDIRGTIFRQTMFAEFEKITHEMAEAGEPLTLQAFQDVYRGLLEKYFGPEFTLDDATVAGMSAHPALLPGVLRLQVRHRPVGRDRSEPTCAARWRCRVRGST